MIGEGKLREIHVFGSDHLQPSEYEAIMEAYSYSHFVHIPVNHLPLNQLDSINSETLEKMLATSLLCKYRGASTSLAREICRRHEPSTKMHAYGHCMLAFYLDEQWTDMHQFTTAVDLFDYLQHDVSDGRMCNPLLVQVVSVVLKSWMHAADIAETVHFLDLLLTTGMHMESSVIGSPDVLQQTVTFLRHHGKHDLSHRLLSLSQHNLQRNVFDVWGRGRGRSQCQSRVNQGINELISFSTCLQDKEDMKYLSNVYTFYLKNILPSRSSYSNRLIDAENIMTSVLNPYWRMERHALGEYALPMTGNNEKYFQNKAARALVGYQFYNRLQHKQKDRGLYSSKMFTQVGCSFEIVIPLFNLLNILIHDAFFLFDVSARTDHRSHQSRRAHIL
jgi:hypothetical protein